MGIRNLVPPNCARCNAEAYEGFVKIEVNGNIRGFNLCGYCLPIVEGKIIGFISDTLTGDTNVGQG